MADYTPAKSKQIALARLDLIRKWLEFRKKSTNKLQADYDFVKLHNTSCSHLFEILGKISRGSLHRWYAMLNGTEDYTKLLPQYKYSKVDEYRTVLTDEEIKIFMNLLLHPNKISIGKAIALTKYKLKEQRVLIRLVQRCMMQFLQFYRLLHQPRLYLYLYQKLRILQ